MFVLQINKKKKNKDSSLHLGRNYARKVVLGHYLFLVAYSFPRASLSENCSLLGIDNVRGQISEHIFAPNGNYCLYTNNFKIKWIVELMRAPELPFESYESNWILFFANLTFSSVSSPTALKMCLRFAIFNCSEKLQNNVEIGFKKMWSRRTKIALRENIFRNKQTRVCRSYVKLATIQMEGNQKNFLGAITL